ncbi:MAG: hypothetical protein WA771_08820 [Chthoniobacterales bacterium]
MNPSPMAQPPLPDLPDYDPEIKKTFRHRLGSLVRRKLFWLLVVFVVGTALTVWRGPDVYRDLKGRRALSFIEKGQRLVIEGDPIEGAAFVRRGVLMAPADRRVREKLILLQALEGKPAAVEAVRAKIEEGRGLPSEILTVAEQLSYSEDFAESQRLLAQLPNNLPARLENRRDILAIRSLASTDSSSAIAKATRLSRVLPGPEGDPVRVVLAALLLDLQPPDLQAANRAITSLLDAPGLPGVQALRLAARQLIRAPGSLDVDVATVSQKLATHPNRVPADVLWRAQMNVSLHPDTKRQALADFVSSFLESSPPLLERMAIAKSLRDANLADQIPTVLPEELASRNFDALVARIDALVTLERWDEARNLLDAADITVLSDLLRHALTAIVARKTFESDTEKSAQSRAIESIERSEVSDLVRAVALARQNNQLDIARAIYRRLSEDPETELIGLHGLIDCSPPNTPTDDALAIYEQLQKADRGSTLAALGTTYLNLLSETDLAANRVEAHRLARENPSSTLAVSVAALAELRMDDPIAALEAYQKSTILESEIWHSTPDCFQAIRVAVLEANGLVLEADRLRRTISTHDLRPEEIELLSPTMTNPTATSAIR